MASTSDSILTWQSALWSLLAVALNTMSQPSGKILGLPSSWNFVLRSSPLVCLASAVESVVSIIVYRTKERSWEKALDQFVALRFEDRKDDEDGSFSSLRKNRIFRGLLFVFCAVLTSVKLYATSGIPLTQAICIAYLATFVVDEVATTFSSPVNLRPPPARPVPSGRQVRLWGNLTTYELYARLVLGASVLFAVGFLAYTSQITLLSALSTIPADPEMAKKQPISAYWIPWAASIIMPILAGSISEGILIIERSPPFLRWTFWIGVLLTTVIGIAVSEESDDGSFVRLWHCVGACFVWLVAVLLQQENYNIGPSGRLHDWRVKQIISTSGTLYMALHLFVGVIGYAFAYQGAGTYRPAWTEKLP